MNWGWFIKMGYRCIIPEKNNIFNIYLYLRFKKLNLKLLIIKHNIYEN